MRQISFFIFLLLCYLPSVSAAIGASASVSSSQGGAGISYDNPDTLFVARDGTGQFRNISEAIEVCRAFMEYHKVIFVKRGVYKEKLIIPSWLTNIEICGEDAENTIITYDDHANITMGDGSWAMGDGPRLGQAVALHTEGDRLRFIGCRFLGHQDTVYTGVGGTRLYFEDCYIEGTTDFIFGPSTAWFENCEIHSKADSYITAASTPADVAYGYVFNRCRLTADEGVSRVYLGRPWRPYAYTLFMNCTMGNHIVPAGWDNWKNAENEKTARYLEYNNTGEGARMAERVAWSRQLSKKEAAGIALQHVIF